MRSHLLGDILWLAVPALLLGVWVAMRRRGLYRQYPHFFNYVAFQTLTVPVKFALLRYQSEDFFYFDWATTVLSVLLSYAVLQELLTIGLQSSGLTTKVNDVLLAGSLVIMVAAQLPAIVTQNSGAPDILLNLAWLAHRSVLIAQCSLMILLLVLSRKLGITRRSLPFGITLGLALPATVSLLFNLMFTLHFQTFGYRHVLARFNSAIQILACGIWLAYTMVATDREHTYSWTRAVPR